MKLYGNLASNYVARVVLAARLKGLDLPLLAPPGGLKSPEYLAMNPLGKMPALEHDGRYLFESSVLGEYLEEAFPATPLLPADPWQRARARLLVRILDVYISPETGVLFRNLGPAQRDAAAVEAASTRLAEYFVILDGQMAVAGFAAGPAASLADCALLPTLMLLQKTVVPAFGIADPAATLPRLTAWFAHARADARFSAFMAEYDVAVDAFLKWLAAGRP
jgi:glutathione S-transferase